jgi:hypothetical protein
VVLSSLAATTILNIHGVELHHIEAMPHLGCHVDISSQRFSDNVPTYTLI